MKSYSFSGPGTLLMETISGSKAYGLSLPHSDTDIRGVFLLPKKMFYGLGYIEQTNDPSNDIIHYELKRFFDLLLKSNPNILELLFTPEDCVIYKHPLMELIDPKTFLARTCRNTFAEYAMAQIKKARGLNKKIVNPFDSERKSILDFCYIAEGQKSMKLKLWLISKGLQQKQCGLVKLNHMNDVYALFYDQKQTLGYKGIMNKLNANDIALSSVPKDEKPLAMMSFNRNRYSTYCKEYKAYWEWVEKRNAQRYEQTLAHGKNYDAKNMMHVFRLLDMAAEIATIKKVIVRRPDRDALLKIRDGAYLYDDLVKRAEEKIQKVNDLFDKSDLPEHPDKERAEELLYTIRSLHYEGRST